MIEEFLEKYICQYDNRYSFVIDADGKVANAYLLFEDNIIADVWLNNQVKIEKELSFANQLELPYCNTLEFISSTHENNVLNFSPLNIIWKIDKSQNIIGVLISFEGEVYNILEVNSKIGWSNIVSKDGPLAKKMTDDKVESYTR